MSQRCFEKMVCHAEETNRGPSTFCTLLPRHVGLRPHAASRKRRTPLPLLRPDERLCDWYRSGIRRCCGTETGQTPVRRHRGEPVPIDASSDRVTRTLTAASGPHAQTVHDTLSFHPPPFALAPHRSPSFAVGLCPTCSSRSSPHPFLQTAGPDPTLNAWAAKPPDERRSRRSCARPLHHIPHGFRDPIPSGGSGMTRLRFSRRRRSSKS
jgi:hypothetical protein